MSWWEKEISQDTARSFLNECKEYTFDMIKKFTPELHPRQFKHSFQNSNVPFLPIGAIVHSSLSRSVWDTIRSIAYGVHGSHFIVTGHNPPKKYELLSKFPAAILAPMPSYFAVPGNGYLSKTTWSIELRNCGRLRPWYSIFESDQPSPLYYGEERDNFFKYTGKHDPNFFCRDNLWRTPFNGDVLPWMNYYYEVPTLEQMKALVALLRVLKALNCEYEMDDRLILPSTAVNGGITMPHIDWALIRKLANNVKEEVTYESFNEIHAKTSNKEEWIDNERKDEAFISLLNKMHSWRTNPDDNEFTFIMTGPKVRWPRLVKEHREALKTFGYDTSDMNFAARMFVFANRMVPSNLDDVPYSLLKKLDIIKES